MSIHILPILPAFTAGVVAAFLTLIGWNLAPKRKGTSLRSEDVANLYPTWPSLQSFPPGNGGNGGVGGAGQTPNAYQTASQNSYLAQYGLQNAGYSNVLAAHQAQLAAQTLHQPPDPAVDPDQPNTLGWRYWMWNPKTNRLMSPSQRTDWEEAELHCETWAEADVVRGVAGIHARLVPLNWRTAQSSEVPPARGWKDSSDGWFAPPLITGIVERFGRFVLGTEGWRAEWVVIKQLYAPTTEIGLSLEKAYPDVEILYPEETENAHR